MEPTTRKKRRAFRALCTTACALLTAGWANADPCQPLVQRIASQMAAKGITDHALKVVPIDAETDGRVVGWCDTRQRKVVYMRGAAAAPVVDTPMRSLPAVPPAVAQTVPTPHRPAAQRVRVQLPARVAPVAPTSRPRVITECRDGLVIVQGDCPG